MSDRLPSRDEIIQRAKENKGKPLKKTRFEKGGKVVTFPSSHKGIPSGSNYIFNFTGEIGEFAVLMVVNSVLTIISLGFYYPFAITEVRKYFYSHTTLNNIPFQYTGDGASLLKAYQKAILGGAIFYALSFSSEFVGGWFAGAVGMAKSLFFFYIIPRVFFEATAYRLDHSFYNGTSFQLKESGKRDYLSNFYIYGFLAIVTGGFLAPLAFTKVRTSLFKNVYYGNIPMSYSGSSIPLFSIVGLSIILNLGISFIAVKTQIPFLMVFTIPVVIFAIFLLDHYVKSHTWIGNSRMKMTMSFSEYALWTGKMGVVTILSLGLTTPFLKFIFQGFTFKHLVLKGNPRKDLYPERKITIAKGSPEADIFDEIIEDIAA